MYVHFPHKVFPSKISFSTPFFSVFLRPVFSNPKSIQASVTLLEKLAIILDKSTEEDMRNLVLPLLFNSLESKMSQIQVRRIMFHQLLFSIDTSVQTKDWIFSKCFSPKKPQLHDKVVFGREFPQKNVAECLFSIVFKIQFFCKTGKCTTLSVD